MPGLFDPLVLRNLRLRNRIVFPPMAQDLATEHGEVTEPLIEHYVERARGGAGLLMVEHSYVLPAARFSARQVGLCDDRLVPGLARLVQAVHDAGAALGIQLAHAGARSRPGLPGSSPVGPSTVPLPDDTIQPRMLTIEEIRSLPATYVAASLRALRAGFDAIEIHGAHGFLLSSFLSPLTNRREDEYGGTLEARARLALEITRAVRLALGAEPELWLRLGAADHLPGGLTIEDGCRVAGWLKDAGIDVLDISGGLCGSRPSDRQAPGFFVEDAERVRRAASIPVVGVGGIADPVYADRIVREGRVDLVAVGRAILVDSLWPEKARNTLARRG